MKANYDTREIELSEGYVNALKKVLAAEVRMMQAADPEYADAWYWGRATVLNLADVRSAEFQYGSKEDMPDDGLGRFAVVVDKWPERPGGKTMSDNERIAATLDRLISNMPAACKVLLEEGYANLAGQLGRDCDNLVYWQERGGLIAKGEADANPD